MMPSAVCCLAITYAGALNELQSCLTPFVSIKTMTSSVIAEHTIITNYYYGCPKPAMENVITSNTEKIYCH